MAPRKQLRICSAAGCSTSRSSSGPSSARLPARQLPHRRSRPAQARCPAPPVAAIRAVESFDGSFQLEEEQEKVLTELLESELFCQQVVRDCQLPEGSKVAYTGVLFQPQPWTPTARKGMPLEIEQQYYGKEEYTFINVPPVFKFQAKVFNPPRLCAVYKRL